MRILTLQSIKSLADRSLWVIIIVVGALALVGSALKLARTDAAERVQSLERDLISLQARNTSLEDSNSRLRHRVRALRTDPRMVEKVAREAHGLAHPGSLVYLFPRQ